MIKVVVIGLTPFNEYLNRGFDAGKLLNLYEATYFDLTQLTEKAYDRALSELFAGKHIGIVHCVPAAFSRTSPVFLITSCRISHTNYLCESFCASSYGMVNAVFMGNGQMLSRLVSSLNL